jgi:hypothetical protein
LDREGDHLGRFEAGLFPHPPGRKRHQDIERGPDRREDEGGWRKGGMDQPGIPGGNLRRDEQAGQGADAKRDSHEKQQGPALRLLRIFGGVQKAHFCCNA